MTPTASLAIYAAPADLRGSAAVASTLRSLYAVSAADVLRLGASLLVFGVLWWPFVVAGIVGAWRFFRKAGRPGWACLVPGYNAVEFLRVAKLPAWLAVLFLVPLVNVVLFAVACIRVARAFRKGPRFAAGLVLLPPFYMANLGLGPARYRRFEVFDGARRARADAAAARAWGARPEPADAPQERVAVGAGGGRSRGSGVLHLVDGGGTRGSEAAEPSAARPIHTLDLG